MRIVAQRVTHASVTIGGKVKSEIGLGMLILLGIEEADDEEDIEWLCQKLTKLRIFDDDTDSMNLDINQVGGSFLVVSQFTLHALTKKGNRPSFIRAARPEQAIPLYERFLKRLAEGAWMLLMTCHAKNRIAANSRMLMMMLNPFFMFL